LFTVKVKPGSSKGPLVQDTSLDSENPSAQDRLDPGYADLTVFLRAKAVDGAANKQLIQVLSKHFGVSKSSVTIVKGDKSRIKFVEIH
jgi:uncharacterized protein (TIGR00251 family)